jgi:hypothetical protein
VYKISSLAPIHSTAVPENALLFLISGQFSVHGRFPVSASTSKGPAQGFTSVMMMNYGRREMI